MYKWNDTTARMRVIAQGCDRFLNHSVLVFFSAPLCHNSDMCDNSDICDNSDSRERSDTYAEIEFRDLVLLIVFLRAPCAITPIRAILNNFTEKYDHSDFIGTLPPVR